MTLPFFIVQFPNQGYRNYPDGPCLPFLLTHTHLCHILRPAIHHPESSEVAMQKIFDSIASNQARFQNELAALIKQASNSTTGEGLEACAASLRDLMQNSGIDTRILPTDGAPVVYGEGPKWTISLKFGMAGSRDAALPTIRTRCMPMSRRWSLFWLLRGSFP